MARPRKKDGYLAIANEIVEALMASPLRGAHFRVALCVMRHTYGWGKKKHRVRVADIAAATGLHYATAHRTLSKLIEANVISKFSDGEIGFQKDYDLWTVQPKKRPEAKQAKPDSITQGSVLPNGVRAAHRDPVMDRIRRSLKSISDTNGS